MRFSANDAVLNPTCDVDAEQIALDWCGRWANALDNFLDIRDGEPAERFFDIAYANLLTEPLATVERLYDYLDWPLSNEARNSMQRFLGANRKIKHGVHRYGLAEFGLDRAVETRRFARYCERFEIPLELR